MHQLIVTHFKTRRVGIPALFRLFLAFFNALANEDHSSRCHLDQIRVDRTDKVHYDARSLRVLANCTVFSTATETALYAECSSKCVVCQSASRPRAAQIYFSRVYSALVCHVNRLGTELGTEPSIPTTRKDHSAAAIQRHTHPYTGVHHRH